MQLEEAGWAQETAGRLEHIIAEREAECVSPSFSLPLSQRVVAASHIRINFKITVTLQ
jgi:hypothetical protein